MPTRLEYMLEAERRGILPPDKLAMLQEARKRGLVPGEAPKEPEKEYAGLIGSFKEQASILQKSPEAMAYAADPSEENRKKFLKAAESQYKKAGFGEDNWEAFKEVLGSSLGFLVAPAGAALAGSFAGPIAGAAAGATTTFSQYEVNQLLRKAQEDQAKIDKGQKPEELDLTKVTAAAAGETALDLLQYQKFKYAMRAFPIVKNLLSSEAKTAAKATDQLIEAFRNGTLKSTGRGTVEGVAKGIAFEVPQELAQTALERWGADLELNPLKNKDARDEYVQTLVGAAVLGGPIGAIEGNVRTRAQAKEAKELSDKRYEAFQKEAEDLVGVPSTEGAGLPADVLEGRRPLIPAAQQPPVVPAEKASVAQRDEPRNLNPTQVEDQIKSMEQAQERRANMLSDLDALKERIEAAGGDFETGVARIRENFDSTATRLDIFRKHLSSLTEPAAQTQTAPVAPIPQTAAAQQTLIDEPLAKSLGLKEGPDTGQPVVIGTPQTVTAPVEPTTQVQQVAAPVSAETITAQPVTPAAGVETQPTVGAVPQNAAAQQALPVPVSETVADPLFEPAANAVIRAADAGEPINISTLQRALGIAYDRARTLMDRLQIEGVVTRPDRTGNRSIVSSQVQGAVNEPTAAAETAPRVAEPVEPQPVGGGVEVPPSGLGPEGRVAEVPPSEGVERPVRTAADVVGGEGAVSPALEAAPTAEPAAEPVTAAEPSQLSPQVREQVLAIEDSLNRGEITQEEATQRIREAVAPPPAEGAAETQQTVDMQTADETAKGSTQTIVSSGTPPTTAKQDSSTREFINKFGESLSEAKELTKERYQAILDFLNASDLKDRYFRSVYYSLISLPQQVELFSNKLPSLRGLLNTILARAAALKARKEEINKNIRRWTAVIKKYDRKTIREFYRIGNESTRQQVDFRSTEAEQLKSPLRAQFYALPEDLRNVYFEMLDSYRKMSDEYVNLISKVLSPNVANELRKKIEQNRLKIYFPLYRDGEYRMRYEVPGKDGKGRETVVQFFRSSKARERAWKEAQANGAIPNSEQFYTGIDEPFEAGEAGQFFSKAMEELDAQDAPESIKRALYELYIDQLPASSVRQMFRKRNGYAGFESNMINVYATVGSRMANQLNNLNFRLDMDAALKKVEEDYKKYSAENKGDLSVERLKQNLNVRMERIQNPSNSGFLNALANFGTSFAYRFYILGNISTAITNLSQLGIAYSVLEGKHRGNAGKAMQDAVTQYFKGGFDTDGEPGFRFNDWSFGVGLQPGSDLEKLYNTAIQQGAIRRSIGYEAVEGRKSRISPKDYMGVMARLDNIFGWIFQNSERMNREVTLIAAFNLELKSNGGNVQEAIQYAIDTTGDVHGSTVSDVAPTAFQNDIGRVAFIFKGFAQAQLFLQYKLLRQVLKGETPEMKKIAATQFLAISAMAFLIAGLQGMPFYGLYSVLAGLFEQFLGDPDNPRNPDYATREAVTSSAYDGFLSNVFGIDLASRAGFSNLLWRDDDKRVDEIGPVLFAAEQLFGASYGVVTSMARGVKDFKEGHLDRAAEEFAPAAARNVMKAFRYAKDGLVNRKGEVLVKDFSAWNIFMQGIGFTPLEVAQKQKAAAAAAEEKSSIEQRRQNIMNELYLARLFKDKEAYNDAIKKRDKFNQSPLVIKRRRKITNEQIMQSYITRKQQTRASVYGVHYPMSQRPAYKKFMLEEYDKKEED